METINRRLVNQFIRYHDLLLRYHHQARRENGPFMNTMRGQGRVLTLLKMKPEITQKELAYLLDMRVQSLSELLSKLEGKGYITRTPSESDRRVMVIKLTEAGAAAIEEEEPAQADVLFQCLEEGEKAMLENMLALLISTMEAYLEEAGAPGQGNEPFEEMHGRGGFGPRHDRQHPHPPGWGERERMFQGGFFHGFRTGGFEAGPEEE